MTFSIFFALLQVYLKAEKKSKTNPAAFETFSPILREDHESIPDFVKRYRTHSFAVWENSYSSKNKPDHTKTK
ncbi:hypothetical protein EHS15_12270 [Leptospira idonii]|uniref:Uncharacterized protein n=2 Tax=Leptospira idonii TaxID=1193500 RepID=A0A4R9LZ72_9LEPT|nr:hypothetical protein EHS15_12270 [Leptospira idonii]